MKHFFIFNPAAGNGKVTRFIHPKIIEACKTNEIDYEIHRTVSLGDARNFTHNRCLEADDEPVRFYACGGDGTLNEVVNGLMGNDNAELAVIPAGTGNDFVRNFGNQMSFRDIGAQIHGNTTRIDAMKYEFIDLSEDDRVGYENDNVRTDGYAINMFNLGFDAQAVAKATQFKRKPFINGTFAYIAGVLAVLTKPKTIEIEISINKNETVTGDYLLIGVANGRYSGGGFDGTPQARINDGLMDVTMINKVSRRFFLTFVKSYHDGKHVDKKAMDGIYTHFRGNEAIFRPKSKMVLAIDGETVEVGSVKFNLIKSAVNMVIPQGIDFPNEKE